MFKFDHTFLLEIYDGLVDTDAIFYSISGVKAIGVALLMIHWYDKFFRSLDEKGSQKMREPITPYDLIKGVIVIAAIVAFDQILGFLDSVMNFIENQYTGFETTPRNIDMIREVPETEDQSWTDSIKDMANTVLKFTADPLVVLLVFFKAIAWIIDVLIYGVFVAERFFFLGLLRIFGGLALAFFIIPKLEKWFWNWLGLYMAIYLLIIPFMLVNAFANAIYDRSEAIIQTMAPVVPGSASLVMILPLLFVVWLKILLYRKSHQILYKIFS